MDIQPRTKGKTPLSLSTSKQSHDIQLYLHPPSVEIGLNEFQDLALERLKILRLIEEVTIRGQTKYTEEWRNGILNEMRKQGLKKFATLFASSGSGKVETDELIRKADHVSHFILRLSYCNSQNNQFWFIAREIELFRLRFSNLTQDGIKNFIEFNKLGYAKILNEEKMQHLDQLAQCSSSSSTADPESTDYFKARFEDVPELVRSRKIFLHKGLAYVPASELVHIITSSYREILSRGLTSLSRILPLLERDPRIQPFLVGLHDTYIGRDYSHNSEEQASLSLEDIDKFAVESFPPCMQRMHSQLRSTHHLHHYGRLRYCLFLKGAGLSYENSIHFFKEELTKTNPQKFEKEYAYVIKHSYGKVGSCVDYTPYSCGKLIMDTANEGSCPFKFESRNNLKTWLSSFDSTSQNTENIMQLVDIHQYGHACSKYFEMIHGEEPESLINHPNQFFEESRRLRSGKGEKQAGKLIDQKRVEEPVKHISGVLCPQSKSPAEEDGYDDDSLQSSSLTDTTIHISKRIIQVSVKRDADGSLGFTLCGGANTNNLMLSRPLFVSYVRRGGPVHRDGSIRPGDRLLAVDGHSTEHASLAEAQALLQPHSHCKNWKEEDDDLDCSGRNTPGCSGECCTVLVIEYDVVEREVLSKSRGPLLVELQLDYPDEELGLSLAMLPDEVSLSPPQRSAAIVEAVRPASIAERCGALHPGDVLLSIGKIHHRSVNKIKDERVEGSRNIAPLRQSWVIHIEVLPLSQMDNTSSVKGSDCDSTNGRKQDLENSHIGDAISQSQCDESSSSSGSLKWNSERWLPPPPQPPPRTQPSDHEPSKMRGCESSAAHDSPCEEISNLEAFLQSTNFRDSNDSEKMILWQRSLLSMGAAELDCAHSSDNQEDSQDQIKFSQANQLSWFSTNNGNLDERCPSLLSGELNSGANRMNAIANSTSCYQLMPYTEVGEAVIHVVQVSRNGGPLGITLSGTEDPLDHITISALVEGGPAKCTAALHVGDRLLAVGGESLSGRPLSEAVALLRAATDPVLLHVARVSSLSVDQSFVGNEINIAKTPPCIYEIEASILPCVTSSIAIQIAAQEDEAGNISASPHTSTSPATICSCPSTNYDNPHLKQCNRSHNSMSTVLRRPLLYELDTQSSLNHNSSSSVGSIRGGQVTKTMHSDTLHITLFKDGIYEDFGFSVSDGLYERGVFVNRIRKGGPADVGSLQPYDRIIQVNDTITYAFDCCLTVPLIASAGDKIDLTVVRCPILEVKDLSY